MPKSQTAGGSPHKLHHSTLPPFPTHRQESRSSRPAETHPTTPTLRLHTSTNFPTHSSCLRKLPDKRFWTPPTGSGANPNGGQPISQRGSVDFPTGVSARPNGGRTVPLALPLALLSTRLSLVIKSRRSRGLSPFLAGMRGEGGFLMIYIINKKIYILYYIFL